MEDDIKQKDIDAVKAELINATSARHFAEIVDRISKEAKYGRRFLDIKESEGFGDISNAISKDIKAIFEEAGYKIS